MSSAAGTKGGANLAEGGNWQARREALLQAACKSAENQIQQDGVRIGRALNMAARKFRNRSLGNGYKLRLSRGSMRRAYDKWKNGGRVPSVFRLNYLPGKQRHAIDRALLRLVALNCVDGGSTVAAVLRMTPIVSRSGAPVSTRAVYRLVPAQTLRQLGTLQRRLATERAAIERGKRSVLNSLGG